MVPSVHRCELLKDFKLSQRLYTARMTWGAEEHVVMSIPAHQGAIFPPNAASNIFRFTFAPAVALSLSSGMVVSGSPTPT